MSIKSEMQKTSNEGWIERKFQIYGFFKIKKITIKRTWIKCERKKIEWLLWKCVEKDYKIEKKKGKKKKK
jgi:hypothetical protein